MLNKNLIFTMGFYDFKGYRIPLFMGKNDLIRVILFTGGISDTIHKMSTAWTYLYVINEDVIHSLGRSE
ncbi:hypothetical protein SAMN02910298_00808 [Pseudobutyrivibrio sp. YE44]|nr:hypothetical protein SAMN02910298_00808 [Pseudobutyrivibrio sp. YE44]